MYNRYDGKTGRVTRVDDRPRPPAQPKKQQAKPQEKRSAARQKFSAESALHLVTDAIGELETEDLILLLVLYLMYRESGDKDILIMMGAMLLP